jgi:hypothetical protein
MAKLKLDFKKLKQTLSSRMEILGLVVAGVLVVIALVWGISTLAGASSPEEQILKDAEKIKTARFSAPRGNPSASKADRPLAWPSVHLNDPMLALYQVFERGSAGTNLRIIPKILNPDVDPQIDYLHTGIHTVVFASAPEHLQTLTVPGANNPPPVVITAGKRLVVVTATFPYLSQVEEYRKALRLDNAKEVYSKGLAPTFEGLNIDRRRLTFSGGQPAASDWEPVSRFNPETGEGGVADRIDKMLRSAIYDYRWLDNTWDVIYGASVMPMPLLTHDADYPLIKLPAIANKPQPLVGRPTSKGGNLVKQSYHYPFGKERSDLFPPPSEKNYETKPVKFSELDPDLQDQVSGKINWFSPYGNVPEDWTKNAPTIQKGDGKGPPPDKNDNFKAPELALASPSALIRFFDCDMEPGTYQYRFQVRMANPNHDRPSELLEHSGVGRDVELVSGWVETQWITIPYDDVLVYITNQDRGFVSKVPKSRDVDRIDAPPVGAVAVDKNSDKFVPFQVHKFVDTVRPPDKSGLGGESHYVADWSVAERLLVARGEPIGRKCQVEMMVWKHLRAEWEISDVHYPKGFNSLKQPPLRSLGLPVDFRTEPPIVLLDFTGGRQILKYKTLENKAVPVDEDSSTEALLLMPDMTMTLRNGREDVSDAPGSGARAVERRERYENWKKWLDQLLTPPPPPTQKKGGGYR